MEQHPVPQNVTTFQFRLIGDMTLKQFGYLCSGAILAYISYKLPLPFFFTWPLTGFFALLGMGFAFVPVEERPMDVWVLSFFKSIYSPTQYVWSRGSNSRSAVTAPLPPPKAKTAIALKISFDHVPPVVGKRVQPPPPAEPEKETKIQSAQPAVQTDKSFGLIQKVEELEAALSTKTLSETRVLELQKQMTQLLGQNRQLEEELVALRRKSMALPTGAQPTRTAGVVSEQASQPTIKIIPPGAATKAGLPRLTTFPNVVTGIVKDTAGNLLPSVLVTVRDKEGVPLRAFKTNKLGQFAASTALSPGTYLVEVEDPRDRYVFDRTQIVVNNTLIPAIEVIAKSQKELERAKLAQQIFGNQT